MRTEKWMEEAEREIKAYLAGPPLVLKSGNGEIAAIIARHYAAREREVQELATVARRLTNAMGELADGMTLDRTACRTLEIAGDVALAPFTAAQGEKQS